MTIDYRPETRFNGEWFGRGAYGDVRYRYQPEDGARESALRLAWSNGCPIAQELTGPNSPYDLAWMIHRYGETNEWFRFAMNQTRINRAVRDWLTTPRLRLPNEPVGKYEPESVPRSHLWKIAPMTSIEGYSTPRVAIEIATKIKGYEGKNEALRVLGETAQAAGDQPSRYLALLSESAVNHRVAPERVLHHVYAAGVLAEESCRTAYKNLAQALEQYAPTVWRTYQNLSDAEKSELQLASIPA